MYFKAFGALESDEPTEQAEPDASRAHPGSVRT